MFRMLLVCMLAALPCSGCDTAAKQQQAEQARSAAAAAKLKRIGEDMHNRNRLGSPAGEAANESQQSQQRQ